MGNSYHKIRETLTYLNYSTFLELFEYFKLFLSLLIVHLVVYLAHSHSYIVLVYSIS